MPNRLLKESICTSDNLDRLTAEEERFFYRLIVRADDYGRGDARPKIVKAATMPLKDEVTPEMIQDWLMALEKNDIITIYFVNDRPYFEFISWEGHQTIRNKRSKFPAPEDGCRLMKSIENNCKQLQADVPVIQSNPIQSESNPNSPPTPQGGECVNGSQGEDEGKAEAVKQPKKKREPKPYSQEFLTFWDAYPRHEDKGPAWDRWQARLKKYNPDDMIKAAANYAKHCEGKPEDKIKLATTFLGNDSQVEQPFVGWINKNYSGNGPPSDFVEGLKNRAAQCARTHPGCISGQAKVCPYCPNKNRRKNSGLSDATAKFGS